MIYSDRNRWSDHVLSSPLRLLVMGVILSIFSSGTAQAEMINRSYEIANYASDQSGATLSGTLSLSFDSTVGLAGGVLDQGGGKYVLLPTANPITTWDFMVSKSGYTPYGVSSTDTGADLISTGLTLYSTETTLSLDGSASLQLGISGDASLLTWNRFSDPEIYFSGYQGDVSPGWSTSSPTSIVVDSDGAWVIGIPEPATVTMIGLGGLSLIFHRRLKAKLIKDSQFLIND